MIQGILFDKDGTLFDFNATWGTWTRHMIDAEAEGDPVIAGELAHMLGYDLTREKFRPGSIVIAETVDAVADAILRVLPGDKAALIARMNAAGRDVTQIEATPLGPFFTALRARNLSLGVATNDSETGARSHLAAAGVTDHLDFIAGYDSGFGGKPAPGQLQAFCDATGLVAADCVMVGDSLHDLSAGRAAGMTTIGVLTGPAPASELSPLADAILPSIAALPDWLDRLS